MSYAKKPWHEWHDGKIPIHDHFDGESNCVQCRGPCKLTGAELVLTQLIASMFSAWAECRGEPVGPGTFVERGVLRDAGVDVELCGLRAMEAKRSTEPLIKRMAAE